LAPGRVRESRCAWEVHTKQHSRPTGEVLWISCDTGDAAKEEPFEAARGHRLTLISGGGRHGSGGPRRPCRSEREVHRRLAQVTERDGVAHTWISTTRRRHHIGSDLRLYIRSSAHYGSDGWGFESSRVRHLTTAETRPAVGEQHGRLLLWGAAEMPPPAAWQRSLASGHHKRSRRMKGCSPGDGEGPPERSGRSVSGGVVGCRARCGCSQRLPGPVVVQSAKT